MGTLARRTEPVVQPNYADKWRLRMKRFIMVLAVAALMAVMLVAMAAPAFAAGLHREKGQKDTNPGFTANNISWESSRTKVRDPTTARHSETSIIEKPKEQECVVSTPPQPKWGLPHHHRHHRRSGSTNY